jgi:hypothetical protein
MSRIRTASDVDELFLGLAVDLLDRRGLVEALDDRLR